MLGGYRLTSITILKMLGGDTWSMFQFHHVPCSMFKSMFKYDEEMLCFLVQITQEHLIHHTYCEPCCYSSNKALLKYSTTYHNISSQGFEGGEPFRRGGLLVWMEWTLYIRDCSLWINMNNKYSCENVCYEWLWTS